MQLQIKKGEVNGPNLYSKSLYCIYRSYINACSKINKYNKKLDNTPHYTTTKREILLSPTSVTAVNNLLSSNDNTASHDHSSAPDDSRQCESTKANILLY